MSYSGKLQDYNETQLAAQNSAETMAHLQHDLLQAASDLISKHYEAQLLNIESNGYHQLRDRISRHAILLGQEVDAILWRNRVRQ